MAQAFRLRRRLVFVFAAVFVYVVFSPSSSSSKSSAAAAAGVAATSAIIGWFDAAFAAALAEAARVRSDARLEGSAVEVVGF
jgi:hypothetical protein